MDHNLVDVSPSQDITIMNLPTEELTSVQRASVIDVCNAANNTDEFKHLFTYIPSGGRHVLTYRGSEVVSHAVATTRWVHPEDTYVMKTAYIDAVATLPACEDRGYGSATMRRLAIDIIDYDIGCLQTERIAFYERLGWEVWRGPLAGRSEHGLIPTPDQRGVMVLRLPRTPPLDLNAGLSIECQPNRIWV